MQQNDRRTLAFISWAETDKLNSCLRDRKTHGRKLLTEEPTRPASASSLDDILAKTEREVSRFATVALVDIDSVDVLVCVKYFDFTLIPSTIFFFFNAHHMKLDSGYPLFIPFFRIEPLCLHRRRVIIDSILVGDHTKWVGAFHEKQDFIDVVEVLFVDYISGSHEREAHCKLSPVPRENTKISTAIQGCVMGNLFAGFTSTAFSIWDQVKQCNGHSDECC